MALTQAERQRMYRERHPDKVRAAKSSQKEKSQRVEYNRRWREANREHVREWKRNYYHADKNKKVRNVLTAMRRRYGKGVRWNAFQCHVNRFTGCFWCGSEWAEIHHLVPISFGGDNSLNNLLPLCCDCHVHAHRCLVSVRKQGD